MKSGLYRRRDGSERLWFKPEDIEAMMEQELHRAALYPTEDEPAVDIEGFIARHLRVHLDQHADLDSRVLGLTEFFLDARPRISVNRDLTDAVDDDDTPPGILGRWRATLAHEASHVVMHRVLFEVDADQESLFRVESTGAQRLMRCEKKNVLFRGGGSDWREVQANMGMAALLMPERFFRIMAANVVAALGIAADNVIVGSSAAAAVAVGLAPRCQVSKQAAEIRLESLAIASPRGQRVFSRVR